MPLFSIVVPTFNRAKYLPATLKSLQKQNISNYEIIIVDDGSTDNTEDVIQPFLNDYTFYFKKENAERAAARNYGALKAKGAYLNFFDSDDLALSNHTSEAQRLIECYDNPEWFHLGYKWVMPGNILLRKVANFKGSILNKQLASGNLLSCNGVFIRRDVALLNSFNEDRSLSASEDFELWLRLAARYPLYYSNVITSQIVDHEMRSVRTINGQKLIERLCLFVKYVESDTEVKRFFGDSLRYIRMDAWSYIALHLANHPSWKLISIRFLFKAMLESLMIFQKKRFYATLKNIVIKW